MTSERIKPCPFCGSHNVSCVSSFADPISLETVKGFANTVDVECLNCGAQGAIGIGERNAIAAWNERAYETAGNAGDTTSRDTNVPVAPTSDTTRNATNGDTTIAEMQEVIKALAECETLPAFRELKKYAQSLLQQQ